MEKESLFGLGAARLYIAPADVQEDKMENMIYSAGPIADGVTLTYTPFTTDITDERGDLVCQISYGFRVTVKGKLTRMYPRVLAYLLGGTYDRDGTVTVGRNGGERARVLLVCPLPDSDETLRISLLTAASAGSAFTLSAKRDSAVSFTLTAEADNDGMTGRLHFG